jgi:hypothetical protein
MNSLLIHVKRNEIDVTVLNMKRVVVKYTLVDPDIGIILQQYGPVSASVMLDAVWADCEFIPVSKLSRIDRYLLRKRLKQKNSYPDKITIGPQLIEKTTKDGKLERNFLLTTCELSDESQRILNQLLENHIPLNKVDMTQRMILQAANVSTKWGCLMCRNTPYLTLIIGMDNQLVMVRNLVLENLDLLDNSEKSNETKHADKAIVNEKALSQANKSEIYSREIIQTFQYLGRTAYLKEDEITILQEEGIAPLDDLSLNCKNIARFAVRQSSPRYLQHNQTRVLHIAYLIPKIATSVAIALGILLIPTALHNLQITQTEKEHPELFAKTNNITSEKELSLLEARSSGQKNLEKLLQYRSSLRWSEQNLLGTLTFALEAVHKGRFLQNLHCGIDGDSVSLEIDLSPVDLYRNNINSTEASVLKRHEKEILATSKRDLISKFNKPVNLKTKLVEKNIYLRAIINETRTRLAENQAPWYYKFDSKESKGVENS